MSVHADDRVVVTTGATHGGTDMRAAFTGLIAGVITLLIVVVAIVMLTNRKFAGHEAAAGGHGPGAPAASHGPATPAPAPNAAPGTPAGKAPGTPAPPPPTTPH
jgi:hypothetical protein